jgi:hypothetical protein
MDQVKKEGLEAKGWKVSTVSDFLELTPEETILIEIIVILKPDPPVSPLKGYRVHTS